MERGRMTDSLTVFGHDFTGVTGIKATGTGNGTLTYIRPTGTKSISANGTNIDVVGYSTVSVAVGGGAPTVLTGTFTTGSTRNTKNTVSVGYSGNGFPLAFIVALSSGTHGNYDVREFFAVKNTSAEPSWTTAADTNNTTKAIYSYWTTSSSIFAASYTTNAASFVGSSYVAGTNINCVKFIGDGDTLGYYIGNNTSATYGLIPDATYSYTIVYSE